MRTPYDTLLRLHEHAISEVRIAINVQVEQITTIESRQRLIDTSLSEARDHAARDALIDTESFIARARQQRAGLRAEQARAADQLSILQAKAMEAYGALCAARQAADNFRASAEHAASHAEQTVSDDRAGARHGRSALRARH